MPNRQVTSTSLRVVAVTPPEKVMVAEISVTVVLTLLLPLTLALLITLLIREKGFPSYVVFMILVKYMILFSLSLIDVEK